LPNRRLTLRGAQIRHVDLRVSEGNCIARMHIACDITSELAAEMGWEIYSGGHLIAGLSGTTKLSGELYLDQVALEPNGSGVDGLKCPATTADAFELSRSKGDTDGSIEKQLRFRLLSTAWESVTGFYGELGQIDGVMHLHRQPEQTKLQRTLDEEDEEDGDNDDSGLADGDGDNADDSEPEPAAAPPPPRKRGRPKKAVSSTITMERVQ
jgi:hypothetical protein